MTFKLDPARTALVAIDLEHAIVTRPNLAPYSASQVIEHSRQLADALRNAGGTIVWVHVLLDETIQRPVDQAMPTVQYSPDSFDLVPELNCQPSDAIVAKRSWGAFYGTNLEQTLDRRGIETIILTGISTNIGVESTARAAFDAGYAIVFAEDAMTTSSADWQTFSVSNIFPRLGQVRTTAQILEALT